METSRPVTPLPPDDLNRYPGAPDPEAPPQDSTNRLPGTGTDAPLAEMPPPAAEEPPVAPAADSQRLLTGPVPARGKADKSVHPRIDGYYEEGN
jgi:hypothetical protein